jgi:hypothetical protein
MMLIAQGNISRVAMGIVRLLLTSLGVTSADMSCTVGIERILQHIVVVLSTTGLAMVDQTEKSTRCLGCQLVAPAKGKSPRRRGSVSRQWRVGSLHWRRFRFTCFARVVGDCLIARLRKRVSLAA